MLSRIRTPYPVKTELTTIMAQTPRATPRIEIRVMMETKVRFGFR